MYVQLEAVGSRRQPGVEGRKCVFRAERATAPVREDERARRVEEAQGVGRCLCRMMSISETPCLTVRDMNVGVNPVLFQIERRLE